MCSLIKEKWSKHSERELSSFQKGDLVLRALRGLIDDPRGKFKLSWSGPYVIRDLTREGAV